MYETVKKDLIEAMKDNPFFVKGLKSESVSITSLTGTLHTTTSTLIFGRSAGSKATPL